MMTPDKFREFLGPLADQYDEAQLEQLRREMHAWAELLLDICEWRRHQRKGKRG